MKRKLLIILLIPIILLQLSVPAYFIIQRNEILKSGNEYKFNVDVWAVNDNLSFSLKNSYMIGNKGRYGIVAVDEESGYAYISEVTDIKPEGPDYITSSDDERFEFPVSKYPLKKKMYDAIFTHIGSSYDEIYIAVKIRDGKMLLDDVYINGMPVEAYFG